MKAILSVFRDRFAHRRALTCIYTIAYAVCLSASIYFFAAKNARGALVALLFSLIILFLPIAEALARIEIPAACYALLLFLCVGALFGSTFNFYFLIPFWDPAGCFPPSDIQYVHNCFQNKRKAAYFLVYSSA